MKINRIILFLCILISADISAQYLYTPFVSPDTYENFSDSYDTFSCPTKNEKAYECFITGINNIVGKKMDIAIVYFSGAAKKDSLFCDAYDYLAYCYRKKNEPENALKTMNALLKVDPSNYSAQKLKGDILFFDMKDYNLSAQYFRKQSNDQPNNPEWMFYLTKSMIELNELDTAAILATETEWLYKQKGNLTAPEIGLYLQGIINYKAGNFEEAVKALGKIATVYQEDAEYNYIYGVCLLKLEDPKVKKAKEHIEKAYKYGYDVEKELVYQLGI